MIRNVIKKKNGLVQYSNDRKHNICSCQNMCSNIIWDLVL